MDKNTPGKGGFRCTYFQVINFFLKKKMIMLENQSAPSKMKGLGLYKITFTLKKAQ